MDINDKLPIAERSITSISRHEDRYPSYRIAALEKIKTFIDGEIQAIQEAEAAAVAEDFG